jgi:hypothetical protein
LSPATGRGAAAAAAGGVFAAVGLYQAALAAAAFFYRPEHPAGRPGTRVLVLVPAHDEAALIGRCVRALRDQRYPAELYDVLVVADNCTDDTAAIAEAAGAEVLVRDEPGWRGKGQALRWAIDRILARQPAPDAVAVVDADSVAERDFLAALVAPLERGASVVQGESLLAADGDGAAALRSAAFLLINRVQPSGRTVLGLPCRLSGNGMLFRREILANHPWSAFSSTEDVEYSIQLRLAGVRPTFAGGAILLSPTAPTSAAARHQQLRWEGGKLHVARGHVRRLLAEAVRRRDPLLLESAVELAVPPLGLLAGGAAVGATGCAAGAATGRVPAWAVVPWAIALVAIPAYVLIGLRAAGAPASAYRSLAGAPLFVLRKLASAPRLLTTRPDGWVRTERAPDVDGGGGASR